MAGSVPDLLKEWGKLGPIWGWYINEEQIWQNMQQQKAAMQEGRRSSVGVKCNAIEEVIPKFTDRQFLTQYSLYHNLLSSEEMKIDLSESPLLRTVFGAKAIGERESFEFSYFHQREKKLVLYHFLLHFLSTVPKMELVLLLNSEAIDLAELRRFLTGPENGGKDKLWEEFTKRVVVLEVNSGNNLVFNLLYLSVLRREREFVRAVVVCDINAYESSDKSSLDKYYRKIPREMVVLSFRKDFFEYKVVVKTALSFLSEHQQDLTELNEKILKYLNRKADHFHGHFSLLVPLEYAHPSAKSVQDTFKSVLFSLAGTGRAQEVVFQGHPFKVDSSKEL